MISRTRCYHGNTGLFAATWLLAMHLAWPVAAAETDTTPAPAAPWPPHFTAEYNVYTSGIKVAEMHRGMTANNDGSYVFRSESHATGVVSLLRKERILEESRWHVADGTLRSLAYSYTRTGGKKDRNVAVQFDWNTRRITNTINGESWLMPSVPQVVDKLLYQFALMTDLRAGGKDLNYTVADGGKIKIYEIEPLGTESVKTPMGKIQTMKFRHQKLGDDRITTLWCAPKFQYLPVQVEYQEKEGHKILVVLQSVTGL